MAQPEYLSTPDEHLDPTIAARYDESSPARFSAEEIEPAVALLGDLAGDGLAVEFAVGTGRLAIPLAAAGTTVHGIDFSEPMLAELRAKDPSGQVAMTVGDMTETVVATDSTLVYLVFNTIGNLRTQEQQVACFRNAAAHLAPGGRFVIETGIPRLHQLAPGETIRPFDVSPGHLGFEEYVDKTNQIVVSHHYFITEDRVRTVSGAFRYVWPSELDLMAELAGLALEHRWSNWNRERLADDSPAHVSVWRKPVGPP